MTRSRPRRALRPSIAVRAGRIAVSGLLLGLATAGVVSVANGSPSSTSVAVPAAAAPVAPAVSPTSVAGREWSTSRGTDLRPALPSSSSSAEPKSKPKVKQQEATKVKPKAPSLTVVDRLYTRVDLNVRAKNDPDSKLLTVLDTGSKLAVTATVRGGWRYISYRGDGAWVKNQYLVTRKPEVVAAGISSAPCANGSKVESGLTRDAVRVHRAICARYPAVTSYGGVRADSLPEHPSGRALDAMISDSDVGWEIAKWVRANAKQLGVSEILYAQHIWTVQRSSEGWRSFSDRGSATANHYDHVHVSVYGNAGG